MCLSSFRCVRLYILYTTSNLLFRLDVPWRRYNNRRAVAYRMKLSWCSRFSSSETTYNLRSEALVLVHSVLLLLLLLLLLWSLIEPPNQSARSTTTSNRGVADMDMEYVDGRTTVKVAALLPHPQVLRELFDLLKRIKLVHLLKQVILVLIVKIKV
jgi:hypothetical protein